MTALLSTLCWFCDEFEDYGLKKQKYFEPHLFNVATSRAREHTIIIADKYLLDCTTLDMKVRKYLERLKQDKSIYVPDPDHGLGKATNAIDYQRSLGETLFLK